MGRPTMVLRPAWVFWLLVAAHWTKLSKTYRERSARRGLLSSQAVTKQLRLKEIHLRTSLPERSLRYCIRKMASSRDVVAPGVGFAVRHDALCDRQTCLLAWPPGCFRQLFGA